jgi:hypothetical protein
MNDPAGAMASAGRDTGASRRHAEVKPHQTAMSRCDIGSMCGHVIANQGKSGHIISIYPDAIPMSGLAIPVSGNAIQTQTMFASDECGQRERHPCQQKRRLAFRLST